MRQVKLIDNIGFGCVSLTSLPFENELVRLLETAYNYGIKLFDTAPLYGNGYSEAIVRRFISNKRKDIILTTKFGLNSFRKIIIPAWIALPMNYLKKKGRLFNSQSFLHSTPEIPSTSLIPLRKIDKTEIETSFNKSIEVLKTEYIDNFLLHEAMPFFLTEDALKFLLNLKKDGKVLKIGVASGSVNLINQDNFDSWDILQYENGRLFNSDLLVNRFPDQLHIYHSVLKGIKNLVSKNIESFELAAMLLLYAIKKNPTGKVLFATTKCKTIIKNMEALEKVKDLNVDELKSIMNAIY